MARLDLLMAMLVVRLLLACLFLSAALFRDPVDLRGLLVRQAAAPERFGLVDWEIREVSDRAGRLLAALRGQASPPSPGDLEAARSFFLLPPAARHAAGGEIEPAIERMVEQSWRQEGLVTRTFLAGDAPVLFPPVSFVFTEPPRVLVVSPRDRIRVAEYSLLRTDVGPVASEQLEASVESRDLSALVTPVGGLATYPSMVLEGGTGQQMLAAVAHEWVHAYLFFQPLGRLYWSDQQAREINETAAEMAGQEIGVRLAGELGLPVVPVGTRLSPRQREFQDSMRVIRTEVDRLLAAGQVDGAETYMESQRQALVARGFPLRKLNQAYFAFHGSYGDGPAGQSPIPRQLRALRAASPSLGVFLQRVAQLQGAADLAAVS
ncbi:MAG: hypothetical protein IT307_01540 [Chloroflexi bacterium]|nr:hypothetical protein [Chloroflexota bacterium]